MKRAATYVKRAAIAAAVLIGIVFVWLVLTSDLPIATQFSESPIKVSLILLAVALYFWGTFQSEKIKEPGPAAFLPPLSSNYGSASYAPPSTSLGEEGDVPAVWSGVFFGKSSSPEANEWPLFENPGAPICS